jgi:hypothetical protein
MCSNDQIGLPAGVSLAPALDSLLSATAEYATFFALAMSPVGANKERQDAGGSPSSRLCQCLAVQGSPWLSRSSPSR